MSSVQRQNALAFITHIDAREYDAVANLLSEDFTYRIFPASLKGLGVPVRNKQQFLENLKKAESLIARFNFQPPLSIIEAQDVVVLHLITDGKLTSGKPYTNEYMLTLRFHGEKISSFEEFMDSKYILDVIQSAPTAN